MQFPRYREACLAAAKFTIIDAKAAAAGRETRPNDHGVVPDEGDGLTDLRVGADTNRNWRCWASDALVGRR